MAQDGRCRVVHYSDKLGGYECECVVALGLEDLNDAQMENLIALSCMDDEAEVLQIELYMKLLAEAQRTNKMTECIRRKIGRR